MAKKKKPETAESVADSETGEVAEVADPETQVYVNLSGGHDSYSLVDVPEGSTPKDRRLTISGVNVEHVDEDPATGIWRYRKM